MRHQIAAYALLGLGLLGFACEEEPPQQNYPPSFSRIWCVSPADRGAINAVDFVGDEGWAVGDRGKVLYSNDAGLTWKCLPSPVGVNLHSLDMLDNKVGVVGGDRSTVLITRDGGLSWYQSSLRRGQWVTNPNGTCRIDQETSTEDISKISILSAVFVTNNVVVIGGPAMIKWSNDGGVTFWNVEKGCSGSYFEPPLGEDITQLAASPNGSVWLTTNKGNIGKAIPGDRGQRFTRVTPPPNPLCTTCAYELYALKVVDDKRVFAAGNLGRIVWTESGGDTCDGENGDVWREYQYFSNVIISSIDYLSDQEGAFVGTRDGGVFKIVPTGRITVKGENCSTMTYAMNESAGLGLEIKDMFWHNGNRGFVAGTGGTIARCPNTLGRTWIPKTQGVDGDFLAVDTLDENTAWIATSAGRILRTDDGGGSLTEFVPDPNFFQPFNHIKVLDHKRVVAVGNAGAIYATTDNGGLWKRLDSGVNTNLNRISFNPNVGKMYVVGDYGVVLTMDVGVAAGGGAGVLGSTWKLINPGGYQTLQDVMIEDDGNVWVVGDGGTLKRSHVTQPYVWESFVDIPADEDLFGVRGPTGKTLYLFSRDSCLYKSIPSDVPPFWAPNPAHECTLTEDTGQIDFLGNPIYRTIYCNFGGAWAPNLDEVVIAANCNTAKIYRVDSTYYEDEPQVELDVDSTVIRDLTGTPDGTRVYAVGERGAVFIANLE